jgi:DNA ligase 1
MFKYGDTKAAEALLSLLGELEARKVTGNDAIGKISDTFSNFSPLALKWSMRILDKNLRVGVDTLYNKVFEGSYEDFSMHLCESWEGEFINGWYAQPKYDGMRAACLSLVDGEKMEYKFCSRKGKPIFGTDNIVAELQSISNTLYLDGELFSKNFDNTVHHARTESAKATSLNYHVFDAITPEEWQAKKTPDYATRLKRLEALRGLKYIKVVPNSVVDYAKASPAMLVDKYIADGYEGAVFKDPTSVYAWKRRSTWLKGKKMHTLDLKIVDMEEGTGRLRGTMGAILVDYKGVVSKVGTGFTDDQRKYFWNLHCSGDSVGMVLEINAQEITKDGKLRFPAFVRERKDK